MKEEATVNILFSAALGALVWVLSPVFTGHNEPWDSPTGYYTFALFAAGLLCGVFRPKKFWAHYFGIIIGQASYELLFLPSGPLMIVGLFFLAVYSLVALGGAFLGAGINRTAGK